jgi:hypothetical protein
MARDNETTNSGSSRIDGPNDDRTMVTDGSRHGVGDTTRDDRGLETGDSRHGMGSTNRDDRTMVTDGTRHGVGDTNRDDSNVRTDRTREGAGSGSRAHDDDIDLRNREHRTAVARDHVDRQHESYGGIKWGAAFFGWLSANGLTVLLVAIAAAAGVALGLTEGVSTDDAADNAETLGVGGAIALLVILAIGYFAGGYVAGRMARFDGARQGVGVWIIGLLVTIALAVAGVVFGSEYNVLSQLNLPRIPVEEGEATTAGIIALVAVLLVTLLAAISGGKVGERYHRKVDRAGIDA